MRQISRSRITAQQNGPPPRSRARTIRLAKFRRLHDLPGLSFRYSSHAARLTLEAVAVSVERIGRARRAVWKVCSAPTLPSQHVQHFNLAGREHARKVPNFWWQLIPDAVSLNSQNSAGPYDGVNRLTRRHNAPSMYSPEPLAATASVPKSLSTRFETATAATMLDWRACEPLSTSATWEFVLRFENAASVNNDAGCGGVAV